MDNNNLEKTLTRYLKKDKVPNSVLFWYQEGKEGSYCYSDPDLDQADLNQTTTKLFQIGSITKVFTASIIASLVHNKRLSLSDTVGQFLENIPLDDFVKKIKISELLSHTSGLPRLPTKFKYLDDANPYAKITQNEFEEYLQLARIAKKRFCYSNFGYAILEIIIEQICSSKFQDVAKNSIITDLELRDTFFLTPGNNSVDLLVKGYDINGNIVMPWEFSYFVGAGGIVSSISDMSKFLLAHLNAGKSDYFLLTQKLINNKNALGWQYKSGFFAKLFRYNNYYWHNGQTNGFSSFIAFNKKKQCGFVILLNKAVLPDTYFYLLSSYFI